MRNFIKSQAVWKPFPIPDIRLPEESVTLDTLKSSSLIGIELEMENLDIDSLDNPPGVYWNWGHDGSLRGDSVEFMTKFPMTLGNLPNALDELDYCLKDHYPTFGERTSTHVHVDIRYFSNEELATFMALAIVLEDTLFAQTKDIRRHCIYCRPLRSLQFWDPGFIGVLKETDNRYASVSIASSVYFGSVEFRLFHGTLNRKDLLAWAESCVNIVRYAFRINPADLVKSLQKIHSDDEFESFVRKILKGTVGTIVTAGWKEQVMDALVYMSVNFENLNIKLERF